MSTVVVVDDEVEVDEDELVEDVVDVEDMVVLVLTRSQSDHESWIYDRIKFSKLQ